MPRAGSKNLSYFQAKLHLCIVITCLVIISLSQGFKLISSSSQWADDDSYDSSHQPPNPLNLSVKKQNSIIDKRMQRIEQIRSEKLRRGVRSHRTSRFDGHDSNEIANGRVGFHYGMINGKKTIIRDPKYNRTLFLVHIHKSAGSLICHYAHLNRLSSNQAWNCNVQTDQRCCGKEDSMEAQIRYAEKSVHDFVAIEREMYDSMAPEHYDYIVSLRDSKSRYFSHWAHLRHVIPIGKTQSGGFGDSGWLIGEGPTRNAHASAFLELPWKGHDPLGNFTTWSQGQPDNWNTRIICGPKCMSQAKFQITPELFNYTLERLSKFRHFLFVEDMKNSFNTLATSYGWKPHVNMTRNVRKAAHGSAQEQEWDPLMSALDDAVYEFAKRMYNNDTEHIWDPFTSQAKVDEYFAEGPKYGCRNGCCGKCSAY
jgi:hypothetical protein